MTRLRRERELYAVGTRWAGIPYGATLEIADQFIDDLRQFSSESVISYSHWHKNGNNSQVHKYCSPITGDCSIQFYFKITILHGRGIPPWLLLPILLSTASLPNERTKKCHLVAKKTTQCNRNPRNQIVCVCMCVWACVIERERMRSKKKKEKRGTCCCRKQNWKRRWKKGNQTQGGKKQKTKWNDERNEDPNSTQLRLFTRGGNGCKWIG